VGSCLQRPEIDHHRYKITVHYNGRESTKWIKKVFFCSWAYAKSILLNDKKFWNKIDLRCRLWAAQHSDFQETGNIATQNIQHAVHRWRWTHVLGLERKFRMWGYALYLILVYNTDASAHFLLYCDTQLLWQQQVELFHALILALTSAVSLQCVW